MREGGREGGREGDREGRREGGRERRKEAGRVGGNERGGEESPIAIPFRYQTIVLYSDSVLYTAIVFKYTHLLNYIATLHHHKPQICINITS